MKHICIDLETMGTRPDSAIIAIGAVEFEMPTIESEGEIGRKFYLNVDLQSCIDKGMTVTGGTIMWWLAQSEEARRVLRNPDLPKARIDGALATFSQFWRDCDATYLWAHGQDFDVSIMRTAYALHDLRHPWTYNMARDTRTLYHVAGFDEKTLPSIGNAHNALDDALFEVSAIFTAQRILVKRDYDLALYERKAAGHEEPGDAIMSHLIGEHGRVPADYDHAQRELAARFGRD